MLGEIIDFKYGKLFFNHRPSILKFFLEREGVWEKERTINILKSLKAGNTFVDIGAHVGYYVVTVGNYFKNKVKIFAFEPDELNFECLKFNVKLNNLSNIQLENIAVADFNGELLMERQYCSGWTHVVSPRSPECFNIRCTRLDSYLKHVDFNIVKIDVEGYELQVLKGLIPLLTRKDKFKIFIEFQYKKDSREWENLKELLEKFNLNVILQQERLIIQR